MTDFDLHCLESLVRELTDDPILQVGVTASGMVEVMTGVVRGPLDGRGRYFEFAKQGGRWVQINTNVLRSWVS